MFKIFADFVPSECKIFGWSYGWSYAYVLSTWVKSERKSGTVPVVGPEATSICVDLYIKSKTIT